KTKFKASKIANLTDARYFAAWYVDYLGYDMIQGSDTRIGMNEFIAMNEWVEGPEAVLEIGSFPSEELVKAIIESKDIKIVEVGMFCSQEIIRQLAEAEKSIFFNLVLSKDLELDELREELNHFKDYITHYVIDLNQLDSNWTDGEFAGFIKELIKEKRVFLDGNIPISSMDHFLKEWNNTGLSAKGGEEEKVGFKSYDELDEIFEALEIFE
ncbi:MAG: hypothetical protein ACPG5P_05730, partial [Saprospiraceae bacterium]